MRYNSIYDHVLHLVHVRVRNRVWDLAPGLVQNHVYEGFTVPTAMSISDMIARRIYARTRKELQR